MPKKKVLHNAYAARSAEHHTVIILLAAVVVVILCLFFFGSEHFVPSTVYAPSSEVLHPSSMNRQMPAGTMSPVPTNPNEVTITISQSGFVPSTVTVSHGAPLTFMNADTSSHSATVYKGALETGTIPPGANRTIIIHTPGTYTYSDDYNAKFTGTIVVK